MLSPRIGLHGSPFTMIVHPFTPRTVFWSSAGFRDMDFQGVIKAD